MAWSPKYSLDALKHHLGTNWVLRMVETLIEVRVLLRNYYYCFVGLLSTLRICLFYCWLDVWPNVWSVVAVKVNYLFQHVVRIYILVFVLWLTLHCNSIKVVLVSLVTDYVDGLMHTNTWMSIAVIFHIRCQYAIIRNFKKLYFNRFLL